MARYTEKSEADLAWDRIRLAVQYRINLEAALWRARKLNEILPPLQDEFEAALNRGVLLELETGVGERVDQLLETALGAA